MRNIKSGFVQAAGILAAGVLIQITELLVVLAYPELSGTRPLFARGLWAGVGAAAVLGLYMHCSIEKALTMETEAAERYMRKVYIIRMAGILLAAAAAARFKPGYVMATFLGLMCLKLGDFVRIVWKNIVNNLTNNKKAD